MSSSTIYQTDFPRLAATDSVDVALQRMLENRISDLPVIDASGALVGMFKLEKLYAMLLPRGVLLGHGMQDVSFVSDTLQALREKMRDIGDDPVRDYLVKADEVIHPGTPALEIVLLLHKGVNNVPVVEQDSGRLVGMVSARDLLTALQPGAAK